MSRLNRTNVTTTLEPQFDNEESKEEVAYEPQHPALEIMATAKLGKELKKDHLEDYTEVNPFEEEESQPEQKE
tara:strand:- start:5028 stop:5246 length:219 start_codon:yes stop_codon:yes gene_type:complete